MFIPRSKLKLPASFLLGLAALAPLTAQADMIDTIASAKVVSPLSITSAAPLDYGVITRPSTGSCDYILSPSGDLTTSGGPDCIAISGTPLAAGFEVGCSPSVLVKYELFYENSAPTGATFSAGDNPMDIDGLGAGDVMQIAGCDSDGLSEVAAGGKLTITSNAPEAFSGEVGTIRLEAVYD